MQTALRAAASIHSLTFTVSATIAACAIAVIVVSVVVATCKTKSADGTTEDGRRMLHAIVAVASAADINVRVYVIRHWY